MSTLVQPEPRSLSTEERILLEWLLANGSSESKEYSSQIGSLRVVSRCTCGCPSIDLALGDRQHRKTGPSTLVADFVGKTPEGVDVGVIVHVREGEISELEVYPISDAKSPFSLPTSDSLKQF